MKRWNWLFQSVPEREQAAGWMAAARGAHANGDHDAERRYRNQSRLIRRLPPLTAKARCLR